jgi:predicted O-linked N-acetylglucosamine transferase (SPINDLY family)
VNHNPSALRDRLKLGDPVPSRPPAAADPEQNIAAATMALEEAVWLAHARLAAGEMAAADRLAEIALQRFSGAAPLHSLRALVAFQQQRYDDAENLARKAVRAAPGVAAYHNTLGRACKEQGKLESAIAAYRRALALDPGLADVHVSLGIALRASGRPREAASCYREALAHKPDSVEAHHNLSNVLAELGDGETAQPASRNSDELRVSQARALHEEASRCHVAGQHEEAIARLQRALELAPRSAQAHNNLGVAFDFVHRYDEAMTHYRIALDINPDFVEAHQNIGMALATMGDTAEAAEHFAKVAMFEPDSPNQLKNSLIVPVIPASMEDIHRWRARLAARIDEFGATGLRVKNPVTEVNPCLFYTSYHGVDNRRLMEALADLCLRACPALAWKAPHVARWRGPGAKIRVGFISKFLRSHSVGRTTSGIVATLDRERFEVIALPVGAAVNDEIGTFIRERADRCVVVPEDLALARHAVAELELDVLFYQDIGMESFTYFLAFSRLAPLQCVSFGHPDTTGIASLDYYISAELFEPEGAQAYYREKLHLLRDVGNLAYYYRPRAPARARAHFGLPEDARLYVCGQSLFKFHPEFDEILAEILRRDPQGRLVMIEGKIAHWGRLLRRRWERAMPDVAQRAIFLGQLPPAEFTALFSVCDVALDTIHFNGYNTSLEAFAMGTPVVTWPREFQRGRHTAGMYRKMGMAECTASSAGQYVEIAIRLATDLTFKGAVKARIAERCPALFEDIQVTREFERFFELAVRSAAHSQ